jgi:hypothetical protein
MTFPRSLKRVLRRVPGVRVLSNFKFYPNARFDTLRV